MIKGTMDFREDAEVIFTFMDETIEHLMETESGILLLEKNQAETDPTMIHAMFRAAHSIKAGANLLEFKNIEKLAHALEATLQSLLSGELILEEQSATLFLQGIDKIRELAENLQFCELASVQSLVEKLNALVKS